MMLTKSLYNDTNAEYVEKVLSVIPKYYSRPNDLNMLARSTTILYDDQNQQETKISR
jgi:hypothetical protein